MKSGLVSCLGLVTLAAISGCGSITEPAAPIPELPKFTCLANSATMRLPAELRATLPTLPGRRVPDDAYVSISRSVPGGFAGMFLEGEKLVLTFVDPATANTARAEIQEAFVSHGFSRGGEVGRAEFRGARWTFAELDEWYRYIVPKGFGGPGVSSLDIDEMANTISLGVIDEAARSRVEATLASLGVSCNLVTTVIQPYAVAL